MRYEESKIGFGNMNPSSNEWDWVQKIVHIKNSGNPRENHIFQKCQKKKQTKKNIYIKEICDFTAAAGGFFMWNIFCIQSHSFELGFMFPKPILNSSYRIYIGIYSQNKMVHHQKKKIPKEKKNKKAKIRLSPKKFD